MARQGKIARLPHALREEINVRLHDGQSSGKLLPWLNAQPEALAIWVDQFDGVAASPQNLSEWRLGGYREWRQRRERVENLKTLSSFSVELAKHGGSVADGAASILGGQILEALEMGAAFMSGSGGGDDEGEAETDPSKGLATMAQAVSALQRSATAKGKLELDKKRLKQKDKSLALDRAKFETQTVSQFLTWAKSPEATAILDSGKPQHVQMDALRELMFGSQKGGQRE